MEFLAKALEWPLSSLEGVAFLEVVIIVGLGVIWWTVQRNAKEARAGRKRIYDKIDAKIAEVWQALKDHEETCGLRNEADQRWKGRIEGKLGIEEGD